MSGTVLLTGATGFLGTEIARRFLRETNYAVIALVRAADREAAVRRAGRAWWDWPELAGEIGRRIQVVRGDVAEPRLGLAEADYDDLARRVTHIVHAAADLRLSGPEEELDRTNVGGTANVLALARAIHRDRGLARFSHVSTAYVAGKRRGRIPEESLSDAAGFANVYEASKYRGEMLVQEARAELPVSVFRPGMVVGDSRTGAIKTFNTLYVPLRLYLSGRLRIVPARRSARVNLVPVDYVADAIVRLTLAPEAAGRIFHLTAPAESLPGTAELVRFVREWAREHRGLRLPRPPRPLFLPLPAFLLHRPRGGVARRGILGTLITLAPYFNERRIFQRDNVEELLGRYDLVWRDFLPRLLAYAMDAGFLHRSERTVHEQILFRLGSRRLPVTYHDAAGGRILTRSAAEVRRDILAAAAGLRCLGVRPGDRVALVGLNSTRYLTLDTAIGLVGAVSVPLYYTSPPAEIDGVLADSGARLLFVGAPGILARLGELRADMPVVSFCREPLPDGLSRPVEPWASFLARGAGCEAAPALAPVAPGDMATLRYTSGTTGAPKGVIFNHTNLRWMGETMVSLLPWRVRRRQAAYLSFLPLSHVVEGILAAYSPYYFPAPVDIYFLEEIRDLKRILPVVRPVVFFAVPRIYEKIWEAFTANRVARFYLRRREGLIRGALRPLLRRRLLGKAGLDRCAQLLVGSAPPGQGLLQSFADLGIELHNAYGLTEAPLISLNRLGANRFGTAGAPLPQTRIETAADGELLVRGPQVTAGYYDQNAAPLFRDGWLLTGDLGGLDDRGHVVLQGRKKDLIITSYGKNIHPAKIETLLLAIPGVREAMVVGDGRPYIAALLWSDQAGTEALAAIDRGITATNRELSHPEQVKRWTVLPHDLSTEGGLLTANLKLKRQAAAERYRDAIAAMYDETNHSQLS